MRVPRSLPRRQRARPRDRALRSLVQHAAAAPRARRSHAAGLVRPLACDSSLRSAQLGGGLAVSGHEQPEPLLGGGRRVERRDDPAFEHHRNAIRERADLVKLARDEQGPRALAALLEEPLVDVFGRRDVETAGRLGDHDELGPLGELASEHDFLLIAAREIADDGLRVRGTDVVLRGKASTVPANTGDAEDLAGAHVEVDALKREGTAVALRLQTLHLESDLCARGGGTGAKLLELATDHGPCDLGWIGIPGDKLAGIAPASQ